MFSLLTRDSWSIAILTGNTVSPRDSFFATDTLLMVPKMDTDVSMFAAEFMLLCVDAFMSSNTFEATSVNFPRPLSRFCKESGMDRLSSKSYQPSKSMM